MAKLSVAYTDDELLKGCINNDRVYQQKFYQRFYGKMMSLCSRYTNNREDAMELLNSGFMKVFLNVKSFKSDGSLEGWIRKIIFNHILENHRGNIRYKEIMTYPDKDFDTVENKDVVSDLQAGDIIRMIGLLPPSSRMVFNLFAIEGYSHDEISKLLKISTGTSKWHVAFAREKLKKMILEEDKIENSYINAR